ncbi:FAD synthetase family protein [Metabacillus litoralis]|uniref:FAD synthetase family protein n=1 Tax=Metabacillus TaxID=2675233 RepID=UPI001E62AD40|nr:FAD synthetase family protein [Metabacillus litoralis]UHA60153.1 FAD synthetase family protein [Metabacillus litoralis]
MQVHSDRTLKLPSSVLTIGALDGVHRGHQALISNSKKRAIEFGVPLVVYTFDPPPRVYFKNAMLLTSIEEKVKRLRLLGVDHVVVANFDADYLSRGVNLFLDELKELNPLEIWEGPDFQFGRNREGDVNTLRKHFPVNVLDPICCSSGEVISSSRIRFLIMREMLGKAEQLLGWNGITTGNLAEK